MPNLTQEQQVEAMRLLRASSAFMFVGDIFIQKLQCPDNVAEVARIMWLNDIRGWKDQYTEWFKGVKGNA